MARPFPGFSASDRPAILAALTRPLDVLIVGGGINGTSLARDLALRGAAVGLVEKGDLAGGTSSRSSKLIHGGLRYLEEAAHRLSHGRLSGLAQVGLVFESVTERHRLSMLARHLVRPLPFVLPIYRTGRMPVGVVRAGVSLYDALALFRNYKNHKGLSRKGVKAMLPALNELSLTGGVAYYDYRTDDARLTLENAIAAHEAGGRVLTRASAVAPLFSGSGTGRRLSGAVVEDRMSGRRLEVRARVVVATAGPWTDSVLRSLGGYSSHHLVRPTKGIHIVVPAAKLPLPCAAALTHPRDGRVLFALPFHEQSVLGTTDTDWDGSPDEVKVETSDVDYLLEVAAQFFPAARLSRADVSAAWAGLRPLVAEESLRASDVSREERYEVRPDGLVLLYGGKLTTFRRIAERLGDRVAEELAARGGPRLPPSPTRSTPLPGGEGLDSDEDLAALAEHLRHRAGLSRKSGQHLAETYGIRAEELLERASRSPHGELSRPLSPSLPHLKVELAWAAEQEMALDLEDALVRRTSLHYRAADNGLSFLEEAARIMGESLGWNDAQRKEEIERYRALVAGSQSWRGAVVTAGAAPTMTSVPSGAQPPAEAAQAR